ncbi:pantothenate kinase [Leifsonia sp. AK011]|uniref:nucleoside/nucleotide kinase family protein n=1 Tax=Leifsonia sp. AK011 TaxID=2723075 RepID=UPI0017CACDF7|nr:nucleoside/nucleotide kinase family protein [Leifsonia sp. AK011]NYF11013.1 pantothenate kinase [Leifsonia sp. AK011]
MDTIDDHLDLLAHRVRALRDAAGHRVVVGIAGSPGAGKTTLARSLVDRLGQDAAHLPMDGFHLANRTLDLLGRRARKGAVDTFDGWGFVALLARIRSETSNPVYAPSFERSVDEPIAGEIEIAPNVELVITEGNYLLVPEMPWSGARTLLDAAWFCATDDAERQRRLVHRHTQFGRAQEEAISWARDVDGANAVLIESTRELADLVVSGVTGEILSERSP